MGEAKNGAYRDHSRTTSVAPEVDVDWKERYYSPIAADLWATGRVLEFLLFQSHDPESPELKLLWLISKLLLNHDPTQRPSADADAVLGMLTRDVATTLPRPVPEEVNSRSAIHTESPIQ